MPPEPIAAGRSGQRRSFVLDLTDELHSISVMKKPFLAALALVWIVAAAPGQQIEEDAGTGPVLETLSRYLGPPASFGLLATAGYSADFWRVSFEEDGPSNSTTASVTRDPFLLVVGGIDFYNILGYIDWNVTYRTDNVDGAFDLLEADVETGPGRGNVDFESTLQVPLGYIGAGLGLLGAPPESVVWLNFLRFQWVPIERYFRWEFELEGARSPRGSSSPPTRQTGSTRASRWGIPTFC